MIPGIASFEKLPRFNPIACRVCAGGGVRGRWCVVWSVAKIKNIKKHPSSGTVISTTFLRPPGVLDFFRRPTSTNSPTAAAARKKLRECAQQKKKLKESLVAACARTPCEHSIVLCPVKTRDVNPAPVPPRPAPVSEQKLRE